MKNLVLVLGIMFAQNSFAVPGGLKLVKPKSVRIDEEKMEIVAKVDLKCSKYYDEWTGGIITGTDDSGDYTIGVTLLIAESNCDASEVKKEFTLRRSLKDLGFTSPADVEGVAIKAMRIAK